MGNEVGAYSRGVNWPCCCTKNGRNVEDSARHHCLGEEAMNNKEEKEEKFYHFGPMLLRESTKTALLISAVTDDNFLQLQKILAKNGWQSAVASSEDEAEERFYKLWPSLMIVCGGKPKRKGFSIETVVRRLRVASEEDGTGIFVLFDKLPEEKVLHELTQLGATKVFKCTPKTFTDELYWFERCMLPMQMRLRAASGLFTALENCENAVEITDTERVVQLVNYAYEAHTGSQRSTVLGTASMNRRRSSTQREIKEQDETKVIFDLNDANSEKHLADVEQNNWRCLTVPGPSSHCFAQYVNIKPTSSTTEMHKTFSGLCNNRKTSLGRNNSSVDTPVTEILSLLKDVQKRCEDDEEMQIPIQKAVKILNSTDLYSPLITRFKREDKVASNLFGGLVLNGPIALIQRHRKTSLSEAMLKSSKQSGGMFRRMSPDIVAILKTEDTWHFNVFDLERLTLRKPLTYLGMKIFQRWKVRDFLQCTDSCLRAWLEIIESHYHSDNPYHNSTHAADVLQASAYYLGKENISNTIEHSDAVAALLASVIHDVDHPGRGSSFLINTKHPLALLYNDVSVLESHHAALAFQLTTSDPRLNIFSKLSRTDFQTLRKTMVDLVLATDMTKHFEYLAKFQTTILCSNPDQPPMENGPDRIDPRRIVCRILIKCADVSNPSRPWHICKEWGYRIVEEYFAQTAEERAKLLPLTMEVFDRDTCNVPLTQCSFIDMFVREMFEGWCSFGDMPELADQIESNYQRWQDESKIWPKQRNDEFNKIERYLSVNQQKEGADAPGERHNQWSRLSFETTTVYAGAGIVANMNSNNAPDNEEHANLIGPCTDL